MSVFNASQIILKFDCSFLDGTLVGLFYDYKETDFLSLVLSTDDYVLVFGSFCQVQNVIKLEPFLKFFLKPVVLSSLI